VIVWTYRAVVGFPHDGASAASSFYQYSYCATFSSVMLDVSQLDNTVIHPTCKHENNKHCDCTGLKIIRLHTMCDVHASTCSSVLKLIVFCTYSVHIIYIIINKAPRNYICLYHEHCATLVSSALHTCSNRRMPCTYCIYPHQPS
jgi:hypothetical protein